MGAAAGGVAGNSFREDAQVIGLISLAHGISHMSQLLLPPLFPWLREAFSASYTELGFVLTVFFVTSCFSQTVSGFVVDRLGPRPVLYGGIALIGVAALGYAASTSLWMLALCAAISGIGNGVFHPVDFTLLNRKIIGPRLAHAYSMHGVSGSLGWAIAPGLLVPLALAFSWRVALLCAGLLILAVLLLLVLRRETLRLPAPRAPAAGKAAAVDGHFGFLALPAVWMCFAFFFFSANSLTIMQAFATEAARQLHAVPVAMAAACLTAYMLCSAVGMLAGGFLAAHDSRCERVVAAGFALAAVCSLMLALLDMPAWMVPTLFGVMGLVTGSAGPSRDLLIKQATPENASGRVFGVVYSGLDIGQAVGPLMFGPMMDRHQYVGLLLALAALQLVLIVSALGVRYTRRVQAVAA